jgi:hypothetical protein
MKALILVAVIACAGAAFFLLRETESGEFRQDRTPTREHEATSDELSPEPVAARPFGSNGTSHSEGHPSDPNRTTAIDTALNDQSVRDALTARVRTLVPTWDGDLTGLDLNEVGKLVGDAEGQGSAQDMLLNHACFTTAMRARKAGLGLTYGFPNSNYSTLEAAKAALSPLPEDFIQIFPDGDKPCVVILRPSESREYVQALEQREASRTRIGSKLATQLKTLR